MEIDIDLTNNFTRNQPTNIEIVREDLENLNCVIENPVINNRAIQRVRTAINHGENFHNIVMNIAVINNHHNHNTRQISQLPRNRRFSILSLGTAREMAGFADFINYENFQNITSRNHTNNPVEEADLSIAYLNYLAALGDVEVAEQWIENFMNIHGKYALFILVNSPMTIPEINYQTYPLFTAALWGNLGMVRLLCELGAQTNTLDQYNYYAEETILHIPYINPVAHLFPDNRNFIIPAGNYRNYDEFVEVIREIKIISGEVLQPNNWLPIQFKLNN